MLCTIKPLCKLYEPKLFLSQQLFYSTTTVQYKSRLLASTLQYSVHARIVLCFYCRASTKQTAKLYRYNPICVSILRESSLGISWKGKQSNLGKIIQINKVELIGHPALI